MSRAQYGNDMDRMTTGDIIRRARERAEAGLPREDYDTFVRRQQMNNGSGSSEASTTTGRGSPETLKNNDPRGGSPENGRTRRLQAPPGLHGADGAIGLPISRPAPVAQWPLAGPLAAPLTLANQAPYRPPAGSSPPQRPPRPSQVPSILDGSKVQDPTPTFRYQQEADTRDSEYGSSSVPQTPSTLSRPSTLSSVASIPDFPLPIQAPPMPTMPPPRRSMNLGPPPSARRGASAFYSNLSFVSPIPEESPRTRSHTSYASSAAMPETWGTSSPNTTPRYAETPRHGEVFYDESASDSDEAPSPSISAHSIHDEEGDESRLVRSASVGRRGKAALVTTLTPASAGPRDSSTSPQRPAAGPVQQGAFASGTGFLETSTNSSTTLPTASSARTPSIAAPPSEDMVFASEPTTVRNVGNQGTSGAAAMAEAAARYSRGFSRLSAIRRPPRLDIDAVRQAETRGSLTSLPDLIRRATRLAASLDRGRRPASRFDMEDFPPDLYGANNNEYYDDKRQSSLSGMLAAFPPPAQAASRTGMRQSLRDSILSWPLPPFNAANNRAAPRGGEGVPAGGYPSDRSTPESDKTGRRCCGLPLWGFILVVIIIIILVAAAVIIPIEFLVLRRNNSSGSNTDAATDSQCRNQLTCLNGGTNVVINDICSCVCSNGFNGFDCSRSDAAGCTAATVSGANNNITNATLGDAVARLLDQAPTNFDVDLSGTTILGKLNAANFSCVSQNALVTFNGDDASGLSTVAVLNNNEPVDLEQAEVVAKLAIATLTIMAGQSSTTTLTIEAGLPTNPATTVVITHTMTNEWVPPTTTPIPPTTAPANTLATPPVSQTPAIPTSNVSPTPATTNNPAPATFTASPQVIDFARIAVLFVLQTDNLIEAMTAQSTLQSFFTSATGGEATSAQAGNLTLSNGNSIDLVNFRIDAGTGLVGRLVMGSSAARRGVIEMDDVFDLWARDSAQQDPRGAARVYLFDE